MTQTAGTLEFNDASVDRCLARYAEEPTIYRILMHLWAMDGPASEADLTAFLQVHRRRARRALRILIEDGLVFERGDNGHGCVYEIAESSSARLWVSKFLTRAIHERRIRSAR